MSYILYTFPFWGRANEPWPPPKNPEITSLSLYIYIYYWFYFLDYCDTSLYYCDTSLYDRCYHFLLKDFFDSSNSNTIFELWVLKTLRASLLAW